jgi:catechol 2,3-dioxygenase-like lactoylglutathione lyase family enzyme
MSAAPVPVRGLWHLALRVRDVEAAIAFYRDVFGLRVVWRPDVGNAYLSSGADNLALHQVDDIEGSGALDHLGFVVPAATDVHAAAALLRARGTEIVHEPREHRDGTVSCYCRDPDGNLVQILWLPESMLG